MPNLTDLTKGLFNRPQTPPPTGTPPQPQGPQVQQTQATSYPPAPAVQKQSRPSEISMRDFKYNAFNVDQLSLNITSRKGFDGVTPDMMIWNYYQYNVTDIKANADEKELSNFVGWSLQEIGIQNVGIDFHPGQKVTLSGKYPLMGIPLPFEADLSISLTPQKQILLTIDDFKTGFSFPAKLRDTLIDLLVNDKHNQHQGPPPSSPMEAFSFSDAMQQVGPNQILVDFTKMKVPLNIPIEKLITDQNGVKVEGGTPPTGP